MPLASTTMCRLEPSLPLSVGFGPVSWPPGGLVPRSHQCWPGSNRFGDRKSTRLNSSHQIISYAVFCLKKKEHTSELQSPDHLVCRLLLEKKDTQPKT